MLSSLSSEPLRHLSQEELERLVAGLEPLLRELRGVTSQLQLTQLPASTFRPFSTRRGTTAESAQPAAIEGRRSSLASDPFAAWKRERTSEELVTWLARKARTRNQDLNALSRLHEGTAREEAQRMDVARSMGRPWGTLHGVPLGIKDNIAVKGWPHTGSSAILAEQVASEDSTVVARLRQAGAVMLGQTVMHELAFGMTSINPHLGAVRNPWDPARICGGSSGGSAAAVAAGLVPVALGTDTGGSVRCPATLCGIAGFKPSFGAVSRYGVLPLGGSLDTVGPLARTVKQCLAIHIAIAGEDPQDEATFGALPATRKAPATSLAGMRIGLPEDYMAAPMEAGVQRQVEAAIAQIRKAGAVVERVASPPLSALNAAASITLLVEAGSFFGPYLESGNKIGEDVRFRFAQGLLVPAADWVNAQRLRATWKQQVAELFTECDLLLTPGSPVAAPLIDEPFSELGGQRVDARTAVSQYLRSFNFLGLPALSLPCGLEERGLPVGVQVVGPAFEDVWLLEAGILLEDVLGFDAKPPGALG
jgi:aspartyl-tRNA(Asn)/glutamyl-tRNA(Gln) amidotransferase subunit A